MQNPNRWKEQAWLPSCRVQTAPENKNLRPQHHCVTSTLMGKLPPSQFATAFWPAWPVPLKTSVCPKIPFLQRFYTSRMKFLIKSMKESKMREIQVWADALPHSSLSVWSLIPLPFSSINIYSYKMEELKEVEIKSNWANLCPWLRPSPWGQQEGSLELQP